MLILHSVSKHLDLSGKTKNEFIKFLRRSLDGSSFHPVIVSITETSIWTYICAALVSSMKLYNVGVRFTIRVSTRFKVVIKLGREIGIVLMER